jgi:hypothetical protein
MTGGRLALQRGEFNRGLPAGLAFKGRPSWEVAVRDCLELHFFSPAFPGRAAARAEVSREMRDQGRVVQRWPGVHFSFARGTMGPGSAAHRSNVFAARSSVAANAALRPGHESAWRGKNSPKAM